MKTFATERAAATALHRAHVLREQGVRTPCANNGPNINTVAFQMINGRTGPALASGGLETLLAQVDRLHKAQLAGLAPFDPLLRIRDRLSLSDVPEILSVANEPVPQGNRVIHGDLHVGQFIEDAYGRVWIVDLDDLAIGPPEADLANFTAHLSTTFADPGPSYWIDKVQGTWKALGFPMNENSFNAFFRFALVRRHLKLRQAGRPDFEAMIICYLRESSNFSMR